MKRIDPITRMIAMYAGLSEFDRGRLAQAMLTANGKPETEPRKPGRPQGAARNRVKDALAAAEGAQA